MELEDWALENAALLVAHLERHGIAMTWTEAHDQLLRSARWLETPVHVEECEGGLVPLAPAVPASQCPDFVEEVAAGIVLDEGKQFFPSIRPRLRPRSQSHGPSPANSCTG